MFFKLVRADNGSPDLAPDDVAAEQGQLAAYAMAVAEAAYLLGRHKSRPTVEEAFHQAGVP